jgi:hypothetical protein
MREMRSDVMRIFKEFDSTNDSTTAATWSASSKIDLDCGGDQILTISPACIVARSTPPRAWPANTSTAASTGLTLRREPDPKGGCRVNDPAYINDGH